MLCEAVKTFITYAADVRAGVANADVELFDMQASTVMCQTAMLKLFSAKTNVTLKKEVNKCKSEFEHGKDVGFQEAKAKGLAHANMLRNMGQTQEFSRNRIKSGFAKLLFGNLNMDRFTDISSHEFAQGINPEQFVRWMEQCGRNTLEQYSAIIKIFRCYGRLKQQHATGVSNNSDDNSQDEPEHPTPEGISMHVQEVEILNTQPSCSIFFTNVTSS